MDEVNKPLLRRPYGRSGIMLSIIGFGGIVVMNADEKTAATEVAQAVEKGVNYFDVAPSYGDAEIELGPALQPYRKNCFLACKTTCRSRAQAQLEFDRSLERLRTDYFDLYQLHAITDVSNDVDAAFASDGVMSLLMEGKKSGQIRHLGFSAHSIPAAFAAMDRYDFDSILVPVNFANWHKGGFGPQLLERARQKNVSVLALKALARQQWPQNDPARDQYGKCWYQPLTDALEQELALRFTLSQEGVVAAVPPGERTLFWRAMEIARAYCPLNAQELLRLQKLAETLNPVFRAVSAQ